MRAIVVMYDSLNREYLTPYAPDCGIETPNFDRLAARSVRFDTCYVGSMPCMPARREMHTGRYNFLHRGWGPLEPFDDSVPRMLGQAGVTTHLATDHMHYWEDGGATYHTRYGTSSLIRGQQGDPWKGRVADPEVGEELRIHRNGTWRQDQINRTYINGLADYPQTLTFDAGLEFISDNASEQGWFVQIETFDPHEPFDAAEEFRSRYGGRSPEMAHYDWPEYQAVLEDDAVAEQVRGHYSALVSQCDASLGRVLDAMDEHDLWEDTMLIVCTDHGFLLGEHDRWGKGAPWFEETAHTPLFVWDPVAGAAGTSTDALVQTIDIGPTLLDHFGVDPTPRMQGRSLRETVRSSAPVREYGLFGSFGGHVNITDGRYVYMRASANPSNEPLVEHTLMPTRMRGYFSGDTLAEAELVDPLPFTQGMPVLRTPGTKGHAPWNYGTLLFDLESDPAQQHPLADDEVETRMATAMVAAMAANDAPSSQFQRLGLPEQGPVGSEHLLCRAQHAQAVAAQRAYDDVPSPSSFPSGGLGVTSTLREILDHPEGAAVLRRHIGDVPIGPFAPVAEATTLYRAAPVLFGPLPWKKLQALAGELAQIGVPVSK